MNAETSVDPSQASQTKLEKKFGQSPTFIASTLLENGGVPNAASATTLLKEAIHVISCGYEDKSEWGKEVSNEKYISCRLMFSYNVFADKYLNV